MADINISFGIDNTPYKRSEKEIRKSLKELAKEAQSTQAAVSKVGEGTREQAQQLQRSSNVVTNAMKRQQQQVNRNVQSMRVYNRTVSQATTKTNAVGKASTTAGKGIKFLGLQFTDLNKFVVLALGPLSGVGSRLMALTSLASKSAKAVAILTGAIFALVAFGKGVVTAARQVDELRKQAERTGIVFKNFQGLLFAASQGASVGAEQMTQALEAFSRRLGQAGQETGQMARSLSALGINFRDFARQSPEDAFLQLADAVKEMTNQQDINAVVADAFGRRNIRLTLLLKQGSQAIKDYKIEAEKMGIILGDDLAIKATRLADTMDLLSKIRTASAQKAMLAFADTFNLLHRGIIAVGAAFAAVPELAAFLTLQAGGIVGGGLIGLLLGAAGGPGGAAVGAIIGSMIAAVISLATAVAEATGFIDEMQSSLDKLNSVADQGANSFTVLEQRILKVNQATLISIRNLQRTTDEVEFKVAPINEKDVQFPWMADFTVDWDKPLKEGARTASVDIAKLNKGFLELILSMDLLGKGVEFNGNKLVVSLGSSNDKLRLLMAYLKKANEDFGILNSERQLQGIANITEGLRAQTVALELSNKEKFIQLQLTKAQKLSDANDKRFTDPQKEKIRYSAAVHHDAAKFRKEVDKLDASLLNVDNRLREVQGRSVKLFTGPKGEPATGLQRLNKGFVNVVEKAGLFGSMLVRVGDDIFLSGALTDDLRKKVLRLNEQYGKINQAMFEKSLDKQIKRLDVEREALGRSNRERFIRLELLKAEERAIKKDAKFTIGRQVQVATNAAALFDAREAAAAAKAAAQAAVAAWQAPFKSVVSSINASFSTMWGTIITGGDNAFSDFGKRLKASFIKLTGDIAALLIFKPIIGGLISGLASGGAGILAKLGLGAASQAGNLATNASVTSITSGAQILPGGVGAVTPIITGGGAAPPAPAGISTAQAVAAASAANSVQQGSFFFNQGAANLGNKVSNYFSPGSVQAVAPPSSAAAGVGSVTTTTGVTTAAPAAGAANTAAGTAAGKVFSGASIVGGLIGNFAANQIFGQDRTKDQQLGATIGGTAGAIVGSIILPGIGTAIGAFAGNAIGGLFGNSKTDTGSKVNAASEAQVKANAQTIFNALGIQGDITTVGNFFRNQGERGQPGLFGNDLFNFAIRREVKNRLGNLEGAIDRIDFNNIQQALADVKFAQDLLSGALDFQVVKLSTGEKAVKKLNDTFDETKKIADRLGLSMDGIAASMTKAIESLKNDFNLLIQEQILTFTDPLQAQLDAQEKANAERLKDAIAFGADIAAVEQLSALEREKIILDFNAAAIAEAQRLLEEIAKRVLGAFENINDFLKGLFTGPGGALSPATILANAQGTFTQLAGLAAGGDVDALEELKDAAKALLDAARIMFASGTSFQDVFQNVTTTLAGITGVTIPGFASGGAFSVSGFGGTDSQLVAFRATPGEQVTISPSGGGGGNIGGEIARGNALSELQFTRMNKTLTQMEETLVRIERLENRQLAASGV